MLAACGGPSAPSAPAAAAGGAADQIIRDFTMDSFDKGLRDWALKSPRADVFESESRVEIDRPFVRFYDGEAESSTLEAGKGRIHTDSRDLSAWDGVVMVSTEGATLTSDWLRYVSARDRIVSTAPVTIVRRGSTIKGVGWEALPDLSEVFIQNQRVEIAAEDAKRAKGKK